MKTSIQQVVTVTRHSETGDTTIKIWRTGGMPDMICVEQKSSNGFTQKVELTPKEAEFLKYTISEFNSIRHMEENFDKHEEEKPYGSSLVDLIRGR
jgi:hypothetical protein